MAALIVITLIAAPLALVRALTYFTRRKDFLSPIAGFFTDFPVVVFAPVMGFAFLMSPGSEVWFYERVAQGYAVTISIAAISVFAYWVVQYLINPRREALLLHLTACSVVALGSWVNVAFLLVPGDTDAILVSIVSLFFASIIALFAVALDKTYFRLYGHLPSVRAGRLRDSGLLDDVNAEAVAGLEAGGLTAVEEPEEEGLYGLSRGTFSLLVYGLGLLLFVLIYGVAYLLRPEEVFNLPQ